MGWSHCRASRFRGTSQRQPRRAHPANPYSGHGLRMAASDRQRESCLDEAEIHPSIWTHVALLFNVNRGGPFFSSSSCLSNGTCSTPLPECAQGHSSLHVLKGHVQAQSAELLAFHQNLQLHDSCAYAHSALRG